MIMQCPVKIFIGCAKADFGGRITFSNIALLLIGAKQGALIVSPNPVTDKINLPGVGLERSPIYTLYNLKGQLLQKGNLTNRSVLLEPGLVNAVYHCESCMPMEQHSRLTSIRIKQGFRN